MVTSMREDPRVTGRIVARVWVVALGAAFTSLALAVGLPDPALGQSRSGSSPEPTESQQTVLAVAAKKPKKMPQAKRAKIKQAKIKKAQEYESVSGGAEELVSTTDYDESGNARSRRNQPKSGSTAEESLEVDLARDVITKSRVTSTVQIDVGGQPQTIEDVSESDFAYDEVVFEDGTDYLLKTLEMKRNGTSVAKLDHAYDGNGRLERLIQNQADETGQPPAKRATTEFTYDSSDRPVMIVTFDNRAHDQNPTEDRVISRQRREYGSNGQVSRIENLIPDLSGMPPGADILVSYSEYTYDSNLNLLTRLTWQRMPGAAGPEDVLVSEERHAYDAAGNEFETTIVLPAPLPPGPPDPNGPPPSAYRAATSQKTTRTFDSVGNVLTELMIESDSNGTELSRRNRRIVYDRFD